MTPNELAEIEAVHAKENQRHADWCFHDPTLCVICLLSQALRETWGEREEIRAELTDCKLTLGMMGPTDLGDVHDAVFEAVDERNRLRAEVQRLHFQVAEGFRVEVADVTGDPAMLAENGQLKADLDALRLAVLEGTGMIFVEKGQDLAETVNRRREAHRRMIALARVEEP